MTNGFIYCSTKFSLVVVLVFLLLATPSPVRSLHHPTPLSQRRAYLRDSIRNLFISSGSCLALSSLTPIVPASAIPSVIDPVVVNEWQHPFRYNDEWTGTALPWLELPEAIYHAHNNLAAQIQGLGHDPIWSMGRWPDPILRRVAEPVSSEWIGTRELQQAGEILRTTARKNQAVGLAAQQCGVNARLVFLEYQQSGGFLSRLDVASLGLTMVNPIIVARSPEIELQVWRERCLVLPPTFEATVLRDAWVVVQYQTPSAANNAENQFHQIRLRGEYARAVQHELDHDRGILVTDHVDLDELESDLMRRIEQQGHDLRMRRAYARATGV